MTARLSKRFYDAIGDDAANDLVNWMNAVDLTYRTELLQHNEANFTRFVTLLDSRIAAFRAAFLAEMDRRFAELRSEMDRRFAELRSEMDRRFDELRSEMDRRFDDLQSDTNRRFALVDQRLDKIGERLGALESRIESLEIRMDARFSAFEAKMLRWMLIFWTTTMLGVGGIVFAAVQTR